MFLSRLILNPRNRAVRNDLSDCRGMHRTILAAFPQAIKDHGGARAEFGVLFRADTDARSGRITLLVQSSAEPDWSRLPKDYLLDDFNEIENPGMKRIDGSYSALDDGRRLRFRLRANPTRRISSNNRDEKSEGHGKRVEIYGEDNQMEWLRRKSDQHGFRLLAVRINPTVLNSRAQPEGKIMGWRRDSEKPMKFGSVLFEGELEITDTKLFTETLKNGIGSGKAYGFGLLSIAPAK